MRSQLNLLLSGRILSLAVVCTSLLTPGLVRATVVFTPDLTETPGSTFTLPVNVTPDGASISLSGFQFDLKWDSAVLSFVGVASSPFGIVTPNAGSGTLSIGGLAAPDVVLSSGSSIVSLTYQVIGSAGSIPQLSFDLTKDHTLTTGGAQIPVADWVNGTIQVVPEPINVALGIFGGLALVGTGARRFLRK